MSTILRNKLIPTNALNKILKCSSKEAGSYNQEKESKKHNIDYDDVKLHSNFHSKWWDVNGPMQGLHSYNELRIPLVRDGLISEGHKSKNAARSLEGLNILDVACGGGILSEPLARIGASVTGIDASAELIDVAKKHASLDTDTANIKYVNCAVEDMAASQKEQFDAVVASEIIEHVYDKRSFLQACVDLLKPGGSLFVTTLNRTVLSYLGGILVAEYLASVVPKGTHDWNQFITPEETSEILNEFNCPTKIVHGTVYDLLRRKWMWCSSTTFTYALQAVKFKSPDDP